MKINAKKVESFYRTTSTAAEFRDIVTHCINHVLDGGEVESYELVNGMQVPVRRLSTVKVSFLKDLGLLSE